ncbi:hypothetical protein N7534_005297 [Penicillium rubens]|nr:hypothetical protein N7534_005297 [Penicillium rubens]
MRPGTNWPVCPPEPTAAPPDPLAGAVNPLPPCRGPLQWPPGGAGLLCTPPYQSPREGGPLRPPTPSRSANWRICKIAISSAPVAGLHRPLQSPGSLSPGKVPPPRACTPRARASRSAARFRAPASPPPHPSTSPAGAANSPAAPTGAPRPLPRAAKPRRPPLAPGLGGGGTAGGARLRGDRRAGGSYREGHPCQGPHRNIPRHPGTPHATRRGHSCGPSLPQPRTVGPGSLLHRLTDPIWGVKMQNAVQVAGNCSGGQFLYGGGPCTAKSPYKVGHFFEKLSDILGT